MAGPSVSYTFSNGTAADATQVNTNFTDVINGLTDGTKDLTFAALSCSSITSTGNVTLGNGASDDITISGSIAASIPIKTNNSYDIGSATLGLAGVYYGSAGGFTTRLIGAATSSYTVTLPAAAGADGTVMETSGSGALVFGSRTQQLELTNLSISASVATNALTIAVVSADGSALSSTNFGRVGFRSSTATTGTITVRKLTAAPTSLVISSGSTLGHASGKDDYIYVYLFDDSGTVKIAASGSRNFDEASLATTTAEGGAGAADSKSVLYAAGSVSNVPIRFLGRIKSNQATAGTWATSPSEISPLGSFIIPQSEIWLFGISGYGSTNTKIPIYSTAQRNLGTDMTYATSATAGASITINRDGVYTMHSTIAYSGSDGLHGISLNSAQLTTSIASITDTDTIALGYSSVSGGFNCVSSTLRLISGDVVRPHLTGTALSGGHGNNFKIVRVGD